MTDTKALAIVVVAFVLSMIISVDYWWGNLIKIVLMVACMFMLAEYVGWIDVLRWSK